MSLPAKSPYKADFPIFKSHPELVYLDSGATSQKPQCVIDAITHFYTHMNANIHRGNYALSQNATMAFEKARVKLKDFIHARSEKEILFVRGNTEAINIVAHCYLLENLKPGDKVVVSTLEHHSNIVPWQMALEKKGLKLSVLPITQEGKWDLEKLDEVVCEKTKLVAVNHVSNSLGTIHPVETLIARAKAVGAKTLIDGAQSGAHLRIDVQKLDCDFYTLSGHKMFGPTGIGVLYGKQSLLESMPPFQGGGDMIEHVSFEKTTYAPLPAKFEAGTPHIAGAIGLGAAVDYIESHDREEMEAYELELAKYAQKRLLEIKGLVLVGHSFPKVPVFSMNLEGVHAFDLATLLDRQNIATRAGQHCTEPLMDFYKIPGTVRASFAIYNEKQDVDHLVEALEKAKRVLLS